MTKKDSSKKKNAKDVTDSSPEPKSTSSDDLSSRISSFGDKVNSFIEELRTTGETVFPADNTKINAKKDHDAIVESLLDGHIDDDLTLVENKKEEELENHIIELTETIQGLNEENSKLKQEIVTLQLEILTVSEKVEDTEILTEEIISNEQDLQEIKEVNILNYYNPEHWDRLLKLNDENKLTLRILEIIHTEENMQLIILALMLEADPADVLVVMKNLQDIGVVDLGYKTKGGLNPLITLIKHF